MLMKINQLLQIYLRLNPDEHLELDGLLRLTRKDGDIVSRKNYDGHVTASAFIINEASKQVLLLDHKALGKLLQPGGHIDEVDKTLLDSVYRETEEETGLKPKDLQLVASVQDNNLIPIDVDSHLIPANPKKNEPEHYHHDFRYLFITKNSNVAINLHESTNYRWVDWDEFAEIDNFAHIANKIVATLKPSALDFYKFITTNDSEKISVVAVSHIIPSSENFLINLHRNFNLLGVIPKPKSINNNTGKRLLDEGINIWKSVSRDSLVNNTDQFIKKLQKPIKHMLGRYWWLLCTD